jgi:hypothetical protein
MKSLTLPVAVFGLLAGVARADLALLTSNPPGTPLTMDAGTTSGPMLVDVVSDNPPQDVMAAWAFQLVIITDAGAAGVLTFQDPATGISPNPPGYVFGSAGLGIVVTNAGNQLEANDFFDPGTGPGAIVPGAPGAGLLQMTFLASSGASGLFGIYAVRGAASTEWTDSNVVTQFFSNVADGTGNVRIGEVLVSQVVPEPASLVLFALGGAILVGGRWRRVHQTSRDDSRNL